MLREKASGTKIATGEFGAIWRWSVNNGPVTLLLEK